MGNNETYVLPPNLTDAEQAAFVSAAETPFPEVCAADDRSPINPAQARALEVSPLALTASTVAAVPPVIGLHGKPGAGKDTVAWIAALGLSAAGRRAFVIGTSDPVIQEANAFLRPYDRIITHQNKSWGPYRLLLQTLGQVRRRGDETYWNRAHYANIERIRAESAVTGYANPVIFITGLRTPSDLAMIQERPLAAPAVRVYRAGNPYQADHWIERQLDHVPDSEFQYVIHNRENALDELRDNVQAMLCWLAGLKYARY